MYNIYITYIYTLDYGFIYLFQFINYLFIYLFIP
jgi:hypothetical protein